MPACDLETCFVPKPLPPPAHIHLRPSCSNLRQPQFLEGNSRRNAHLLKGLSEDTRDKMNTILCDTSFTARLFVIRGNRSALNSFYSPQSSPS